MKRVPLACPVVHQLHPPHFPRSSLLATKQKPTSMSQAQSAFVDERGQPSLRRPDARSSLNGVARPMSAFGYPTEHPALPMEDVGRVNRIAQIRGTRDGVFAGILSGSFMRFLLRRSANVAVISALGVGSLVGYASSFAHVRQGLHQLEQAMPDALARKHETEMIALDRQAGQHPTFEAGVAGLHEYRDKSHSTRGDH